MRWNGYWGLRLLGPEIRKERENRRQVGVRYRDAMLSLIVVYRERWRLEAYSSVDIVVLWSGRGTFSRQEDDSNFPLFDGTLYDSLNVLPL